MDIVQIGEVLRYTTYLYSIFYPFVIFLTCHKAELTRIEAREGKKTKQGLWPGQEMIKVDVFL